MNDTYVTILSQGDELPQMECGNFFHSADLFRILERTPGQRPYMVVAGDGTGVLAHMLVMVRRRGSLVPPYLFTQARIYGEGEYADGCDKERLFGLMLQKLVKKLHFGICLYIEFSDISTKMFGYAKFRENGFFPVHWMEVHNSLHSMAPEDRLTPKMRKLLSKADALGINTVVSTTEEDYNSFFKILKGYKSLKIRRFIPHQNMFRELLAKGESYLFTSHEDGKMTGGCLCVYSNDNCYLWYLASKRTLHRRRTNAKTIWKAINHAYKHSCQHVYFMDVGLPFKKYPFRDFILGFGGKPVGTYRWFRFSFKWLNSLLSWIYRE